MPHSRSLEGWLGSLDLRGTNSLHTFNSHKSEGDGILREQAFSFLRSVSFNYHAHCCQLKRSNYSYLDFDAVAIGRKRDTWLQENVFQKLYNYLYGGSRSSKHPSVSGGRQLKHRHVRETIPDNETADSWTCLNHTDLNIVLFPDSNIVSESGIGSMDNTDLLPDGWFFHPNTTDLICTDNEIVNITTQVYRPCTDEIPSLISPSHTVSAAALDNTISPTPTTTVQTDITPASSPLSTMAMSVMITPAVLAATVTPSPCSSSVIEVFCTLSVNIAVTVPPPITTTSEPPTTMPSCDCGGDRSCERCVSSECSFSSCVRHSACSPACQGNRRRRYTAAVEEWVRLKRDASNSLLSEGWFYPNTDNTILACTPVNESSLPMMLQTTTPESTTPESTTVSLSSTASSNQITLCGTDLYPLDDDNLIFRELSTVCSPNEDPFNPCEDLLGKDHVLRSFIWIVILLAFVGNSLVIVVFVGYTIIIKRTNVELFVVHFFYFNLAVADFIMGVYLFTIAIQDARTLNNFSAFDVAWRTEGGCDFAGACAITSTMVSVYVLLVVTVERLYTFSRALQKSHTSKTVAGILMAVGWGFGILVGILPVITKDVNDYTVSAICLPFDVSSKLALSYVLFLLLFTGVVFTAIVVCYIIIFYQVFYRQKATISSVGDKKRWKTELKVALRMGILVLTNFVCWFPIALLGISAAVGNSLVNDITFAKWVMVFIFPINACLNPILYSILSKVFRDNLVLILGKCGICKGQVSKIQRNRAGFTPSVTSYRSQGSQDGLISDGRRGTIIERFRNFSITSTTNLLGRRNSTMSQASSEEHYQIELIRAQRRRSSEYSSASSEDILGVKVNSRRGSAFSGGSMEEMTTLSNPGFRSSSPVGGSTSADGAAGNHKGSPRPRISLGAVPEENENFLSEIADASEVSGEGKQNLAYLENETEAADTSANKDKHVYYGNGIQVVNQHTIDSEMEKDTSSVENDSIVAASLVTDSQDADHKKSAVVTD